MRSSDIRNAHFVTRLLAGLVILALLASSAVAESLAESVLKLTGSRTRIVWLHAVQDVAANAWDAISADYELKGFDNADGRARVILPGPASYANPCITPDGQRVLFTDVTTNTLYLVDWDGSNKTELTKGYVLCTWIDPKERTQWVYFTDQGYSKGQLTRCRIDKPSEREVVWSKEQAAHTLTISADGTRAGSEFPWPAAGVAILPHVSWKRYGTGCNGCIAPDNSYRFFHMGEEISHNGVIFYDKDGANRRVIRFRLAGDAWIPRWTNDVRFLTVNSPIGGKDADIYLGVFNPAFTAVTKWVQITNQPGQDTKACGWVGRMPRPEAKPLIIAPVVRKAPVTAAARLLDEAHLEVAFSEQVQLKDASASLLSKVPVAALALDPEGLRLVITLGGRMPKSDTLLLKGITDCSEAPDPVKEKVAVTRPAWPVNRANLVFQWGTAQRPTFQFNPVSRMFDRVYLKASRIARLDRDGAMVFYGGGFSVTNAGNGIVAECSKANQFSIEALITPSSVPRAGKAELRFIVGCDGEGEGEADNTNFALAQEGPKLVLFARTKPDGKQSVVQRVQLCTLEDEKPNHVVVAYRPGRFACYLNGKSVRQTAELKGTLDWRQAKDETGLYFASRNAAALPWLGNVEGIAIFARALDAADAAADSAIYARMIATRRPSPPRIELEATFVKGSPIPKAADIAPYRDALVANEFIVTKVIRGEFKPRRVRVAQWGIIDAQPTAIAQAKPGDVHTLVLEPMTDHPKLESEAISDTLDENFGLALYIDLTVRP